MKRRREELETQSASMVATGGTSVLSEAEPVLQQQQKKRLRAAELNDPQHVDDEIGGLRPTADAKAMHAKVPLELSADAVTSGGTLTTWRLAESRHKGRFSVLAFYALDFFTSPTELAGFSDQLEAFDAAKCDVMGVSVDSKFTHLAWLRTPRDSGGLAAVGDHQKPFVMPLVSDLTHAISKSFGVFDEERGRSKHAVVIVSDIGVVREVLINEDSVGHNVHEVLRLVQALRYADAHDGEACPANWTPGNATIKADPAGSKEYFNADMEVYT